MSARPIFAERLLYLDQPTTGSNIANLEERGLLTATTLSWSANGSTCQLALADVVGVSVVDIGAAKIPGLIVNAYPQQQKLRVLQEYWFACPNLQVQQQWQTAINNTLRGKPIDAKLQPRHLQIIINPNSGKQQACQIFEQVRPLLEKSYLRFRVTKTLSAKHTKDFVQQLDLHTIDGLVIVGGDGTIHDVIAGLMSRQDSDRAIKIPIGIIPCGTGNGLSKTLLEVSTEAFAPINAAFIIAKGNNRPLDIATIVQQPKRYHSILSLAWGLISDVDIGSEKLRFLGSLRFDLYALWLICFLRTYKGRFAFIPHPDWRKYNQREISKEGKWHVIEDEFIFLWAMNTAWAAHDMNVTPYAQLDDGAMDVLVMRKPTSRLELLIALLRCGKGKHLDLPHMEYYKVRAFRLEPLSDRGILVVDGEAIDYAPVEMEIMPSLAKVNCH